MRGIIMVHPLQLPVAVHAFSFSVNVLPVAPAL